MLPKREDANADESHGQEVVQRGDDDDEEDDTAGRRHNNDPILSSLSSSNAATRTKSSHIIVSHPLPRPRHDDNHSLLSSDDGNDFVVSESSSTTTLPTVDGGMDDQSHHSSNDINYSSNNNISFRLNSQTWLNGPRIGNIPVPDEWLSNQMKMIQLSNQQQPQQRRRRQNHRFLLRQMDAILNQTLCYETGRFRNILQHPPGFLWNASDPTHIQDWQVRLVYMAIHRLFHLPALPEYQLRQDEQRFTISNGSGRRRRKMALNPNKASTHISHTKWLSHYGLSNFDFECPKSKFLVTALKSVGMGAMLRGSAIPSIGMALQTGRIPLFISSLEVDDVDHDNNTTTAAAAAAGNNASEWWPSHMTIFARPFWLTSCPRRDLQCILLPLSPCVLSIADLRNATLLKKPQARILKRTGVYQDSQHEHVRVLLHDASLGSAVIHSNVHKKVNQAIWSMLGEWSNNNIESALDGKSKKKKKKKNKEKKNLLESNIDIPLDLWNVMTTAAKSLSHTNVQTTNNDVNMDDRHDEISSIILRAIQLYLMRPNWSARKEIAKQVALAETTVTKMPQKQKENDPSNENHDGRQYFGLPIRGSDKCRFESTCLSFDRYMERVLIKWRQHHIPGKQGTILLTSEDPTILPLRLPYMQNTTSFPLEFVINPMDVQQGHGRPKWYNQNADAIMISSLAAIKLQLQANVLVGNCCSNFHLLLFELMRAGCGADPKYFTELECLNELQDPRFRICCERTTEQDICAPIWAAHKANTNVTAIRLDIINRMNYSQRKL